MTNAAGLDADANVAGLRIDQRFAGQFEFARADCLNGLVSHFGAGHFFLHTGAKTLLATADCLEVVNATFLAITTALGGANTCSCQGCP
jgi:hypothetical protein